MALFGQLLKELDKETEEFKWLNTKMPKEYLNSVVSEDSANETLKNEIMRQSQPNECLSKLYKLVVINISENSFDCPGMLSEEKVLQEYENTSRLSKAFNDSHSLSSSNDDADGDNEDDDALQDERNNLSTSNHHSRIGSSSHRNADGLSEFNFSERDTPIMSGRDTPSSHSHEEIRRPSNVLNSISNNAAVLASNPQIGKDLAKLPQKSHREDINDKFCKFEINKGKIKKIQKIVLLKFLFKIKNFFIYDFFLN